MICYPRIAEYMEIGLKHHTDAEVFSVSRWMLTVRTNYNANQQLMKFDTINARGVDSYLLVRGSKLPF
jgi:hypothetical protein